VLASPLAEGAGALPDLDRLLEQPGAALRVAVESLEAGRAVLAEALLAAIAKRHRVIADHADLLRMQLRIDTQRYGEAIALRQSWDHADSPLRAEFYALLGQAYAARGDEERSRGTWEYAALEIEDAARRAEIQLAVADSYRRSDQTRQAAEGYVEIWSREPGTPAADSAALALHEIERARGRSVRSASDHRKHADALYKRRRNEDALAAYDHALGLGLAGGEKVQAQHDRARFHRARSDRSSTHAHSRARAGSWRAPGSWRRWGRARAAVRGRVRCCSRGCCGTARASTRRRSRSSSGW
jgi:tetratricopeptide (TPR) repeat protein